MIPAAVQRGVFKVVFSQSPCAAGKGRMCPLIQDVLLRVTRGLETMQKWCCRGGCERATARLVLSLAAATTVVFSTHLDRSHPDETRDDRTQPGTARAVNCARTCAIPNTVSAPQKETATLPRPRSSPPPPPPSPHRPTFSPVHRARKFSAVLGTAFSKSSRVMRPTFFPFVRRLFAPVSSAISMSRNTRGFFALAFRTSSWSGVLRSAGQNLRLVLYIERRRSPTSEHPRTAALRADLLLWGPFVCSFTFLRRDFAASAAFMSSFFNRSAFSCWIFSFSSRSFWREMKASLGALSLSSSASTSSSQALWRTNRVGLG